MSCFSIINSLVTHQASSQSYNRADLLPARAGAFAPDQDGPVASAGSRANQRGYRQIRAIRRGAKRLGARCNSLAAVKCNCWVVLHRGLVSSTCPRPRCQSSFCLLSWGRWSVFEGGGESSG